jgi:acetylornithine/succinyldiaminopimelate/putrescine aminotransferase
VKADRGVRGKGLLLALELDKAALDRIGEPRLLTALLQHGISTTTKGDDAIGFSPPLTISEEEIGLALDGIERAVRSFE